MNIEEQQEPLHSMARELVYRGLTLLINVPRLYLDDGAEWFDHMTVVEHLNQALAEDDNEIWARNDAGEVSGGRRDHEGGNREEWEG